jgi:hypothetical protein
MRFRENSSVPQQIADAIWAGNIRMLVLFRFRCVGVIPSPVVSAASGR